MKLPILPPYPPMEALSVESLPEGPEWQYEPKWDGFRCLAFRDGDEVFLQSKSGQPLARYFPEIVRALTALEAKRFVVDSELVIEADGQLSFDDLLLRLHPAESRVRKLAAAHPATIILFDLLVDARGEAIGEWPLRERRPALEAFAARFCSPVERIRLSPATTQVAEAKRWFRTAGPALDGLIAKRRDLAYRSGERSGMEKVKNYRSADCVVGGFRYAAGKRVVGSLLLGLYDAEGRLNHVGFCSGLSADERRELTPRLEVLVKPPGFTGQAPGGPSRWAPERSAEWEPLEPKLVVEVGYDHFTGGRFRHGTRLLRWRPDKAPTQCTMDQLDQKRGNLLGLLRSAAEPQPKR